MGPSISLNPVTFFEVPVPGQESEWSCNLCVNGINFAFLYAFSIGFWKCSECVVFLYNHISSRSFSDILQKHVRHLHITRARCIRHYINMLKFVCE